VRIGFSYLSMSASATSGRRHLSASASFLSFPITASYIGVRWQTSLSSAAASR
jgi:hypothetical protein